MNATDQWKGDQAALCPTAQTLHGRDKGVGEEEER